LQINGDLKAYKIGDRDKDALWVREREREDERVCETERERENVRKSV